MKNCKHLSTVLFLFFTLKSTNSFAQFQGQVYKQNYLPTVIHAGDTLLNAWQGGMNITDLQMADLNNDGLKDIVIYDYLNNVVFTYIYNLQNGLGKYIYNPQYESSFPIGYIHPIKGYLILKDYNCDNIPDLFTKGQFGVSVSKGFYLGNQLKFTFYKDLFYPATFGPINVYVQNGDKPAIEDIDYDGDLDILAFNVNGSILNYYKNMRVEENLACDTLKMTFAENCWGKFSQGFYRTAYLNATCKGFEATDTIYEPTAEKEYENVVTTDLIKTKKPLRHTGNNILAMDMDNDADKDLIIGGVGYPDLTLLTNGGSSSFANITTQDTFYNTATNNKVYLPTWICSSYEDVDKDGINDLLCGVHLEKDANNDCENKELQFYKNTGTNTLPNFSSPKKDFLFDEILDVGSYSFPTFFDFDHDGKQDLFIGSEGILDTSDFKLSGRIAYYKNASTISNFKFELVTNDFLNLQSKKYKGLYPHFTDVTGDGITDLIMGGNNGKLIFYKNTAVNNTSTPIFTWVTDSFLNADVGNYSAPTSADINKDGKTDLIIGNEFGKLIYFEDTSSLAGVKTYSNISNILGMVNAGGKTNFLGYASPTFTKVDNTRKEILLIGTGDGTIERYDSLYAPIYGPYLRTDSFYSLIQTFARSVPAVSDMNGDGFYDMVIGNKMGGLEMFTQVLLVDSIATVEVGMQIIEVAKKQNRFNVYPNPTKNIVYLQGLLNNYGAYELELHNMAGQIVQQHKFRNSDLQHFSIANLQNGLYSYKIITKNKVQTGTILKYE